MHRNFACLICFLLLIFSSPAMAQSENTGQDEKFKEQLVKTLKENPKLLLEVIQEADVQILNILQQAAMKERQKQALEQQR